MMHQFYNDGELPPQVLSCNGIDCYEVFSCKGFAATTQHIRQPMLTLIGAILFPIGFNACLYGFRSELRFVAFFLAIVTIVYIVSFMGDIFYFETCNAYPESVIRQTLLWPIAFPILKAKQDEISKMTFYPVGAVDKITNDFNTMLMYVVFEVGFCILMIYVAREARILGMLFERGPLGMGVHYGLGQFDEVLNHEELKRRKTEIKDSKFLTDAKLPKWNADLHTPMAYHVGHHYGALHEKEAFTEQWPKYDEFKAAIGEDFTTTEKLNLLGERHSQVEERLSAAEREMRGAEEAYEKAVHKMTNERSEEQKAEMEAIDHLRHKEISKETRQEHRAEELAEEMAREARREAEDDGRSPEEVRMAEMMAYQRELSKEHAVMLKLAKNRTLHEHYRHTERQQQYKEMEGEVVQEVEETKARMEDARQQLTSAQEWANALHTKESQLRSQNMYEAREDKLQQMRESHARMTQHMANNEASDAPVELEQGFTSATFEPASTGSVPEAYMMGSVPPTSGVMRPPTSSLPPTITMAGTSGNFGGNFGSRNAVPSTLPGGSWSMPAGSYHQG